MFLLKFYTFFLQILPVNIKGLAGSVATLANWFIAWAITMTAPLLLTWSSGGYTFSPFSVFPSHLPIGVYGNSNPIMYKLHEQNPSCSC